MYNNKLENISFIKTSMMIIIVLYHSMLFFGGNWFTCVKPVFVANYFVYIARWLDTFHVQTFCMVSGFLYYYLKIEKNKYCNLKSAVITKFKRLLLPYFCVSIFWAIPIAILFFKYNFSEIFTKYILMVKPSQLWFLPMLFFVFLIFFSLLSNVRINTKNLFIIYVLSTFLSCIFSILEINYFQITNVLQYSLYFYFGGYIYVNASKISKKQFLFILFLTIIFGALYVFFDIVNIKFARYILRLLSPIISLLEISLIYYIGSSLIRKINIIVNSKLYKLFEENSFGVYLFHQQIVYFVIILFNGYVHPIIQVFLSFVISLLFSLMMSIILRKNKITKFMFGL